MASRERGYSVASVLLSLAAATLVLAGTALFSAGLVRVYVDEKKPGGENIRLAMPAALVPLGVKFVPDGKLQEASAQLRPWLPALKAAAKELERCPAGPLVEVENPRETVRIAKRGGYLVIDVESEHETVHVSFPVTLIASVAREFEATL